MSTLHVLQGPDKGRTYEAPHEAAVIGRSSDLIPLSDESTSRRHAEIRPANGAWVLNDLNSSNGTFLNGQRVMAPAVLKHGDQIRVGSTLMVFEGEGQVERVTGSQLIQDLVDIDLIAHGVDSSILSAVDASAESVILQAPETVDAVVAWKIVYEVAECIGRGDSIERFLESVADIAFKQMMVDRLVLLMYDAEADELTPQVVRYRNKETGRRPTIVTSRTIMNHVLKTRAGILCANATSDERFRTDSMQDSVHRLGLRSILCVPIVAHDQVHGIIHFDCPMSTHTYSQEQLRLAVAIGRLTGMAIENAKLMDSRVVTERLAAVGEAVAYLSHHIRNILQGMQGGAEVLELGIKKGALDTVNQGWTLIRRNLDRTLHLAVNMLTFSTRRAPHIERTSLNKVVEDALALTQGRADEKSAMLLPELGDIPDIPLDTEGLHQVVHNIVLNALDAVPAEGGRVNVITRFDDEHHQALLSVSDNGPGIRRNQLSGIFKAFHSTKGHGGTGLGLAAAKKIVDELHGEIHVDSTVGEGTTFCVRLPSKEYREAPKSPIEPDDTKVP